MLLERIKHFFRKTFRGWVVERRLTAEGNTLRRYASGYIEHIGIFGATDVTHNLHFARSTWKLCATNACDPGSVTNLENATEKEALRHVKDIGGTVTYADSELKIIAYRTKRV